MFLPSCCDSVWSLCLLGRLSNHRGQVIRIRFHISMFGFFIASLCSIFVCEKLAIASHVFKTLNFCPQDSTLRTSRNLAMESNNLVHTTKNPKNSFQTENHFLDFWQRESRKPTPLKEERRCIRQEQDFTSKHMHLNLRSNNWISSVKRIYCKYVNTNISRNICAWT